MYLAGKQICRYLEIHFPTVRNNYIPPNRDEHLVIWRHSLPSWHRKSFRISPSFRTLPRLKNWTMASRFQREDHATKTAYYYPAVRPDRTFNCRHQRLKRQDAACGTATGTRNASASTGCSRFASLTCKRCRLPSNSHVRKN